MGVEVDWRDIKKLKGYQFEDEVTGPPAASVAGSRRPSNAGSQRKVNEATQAPSVAGSRRPSNASSASSESNFINSLSESIGIDSALVRPACSCNSPQSLAGFYAPAPGDGLPSTLRQVHRSRTGSAWPLPHAARVHRPRTRGRPADRCTSRVTGPLASKAGPAR